jgi:hypothetical protein
LGGVISGRHVKPSFLCAEDCGESFCIWEAEWFDAPVIAGAQCLASPILSGMVLLEKEGCYPAAF